MRKVSSELGCQLRSSALRYDSARRCESTLRKGTGWLGGGLVHGLQPHLEGVRGVSPEGSEEKVVEDTVCKLAHLEAALFLAREPLSTRKLAQLAKLADGTEARTLLKQLSRRYDGRGQAFQIVELAGGFQLLTRTQLAPWIGRLHSEEHETRLSGPALETLSVVAYQQPVVRAEIEAIRGVQCGEILRVLMERDLLRIVGRAEELGRPFLYGTTKKFLQVFGLKRLDQLPAIDQIHNIASSA